MKGKIESFTFEASYKGITIDEDGQAKLILRIPLTDVRRKDWTKLVKMHLSVAIVPKKPDTFGGRIKGGEDTNEE